jgi:NADPH:quinone reductase-like Zn-dependent oxidoreductase
VFRSIWDNQPVLPLGTFAELTVAPATQVIAKPESLGFTEAAASVMAGLTALVAVRDAGQVRPGTRVLISGAAGGVASMAVQIAKAFGADVTGACSTPNVNFVQSLGADRVIDYTTTNYTRTNYTERDRRYDVILDNVINPRPTSTARVLAHGGVPIPNSVGTGGGLLGGLSRVARATLPGRRGSTRVATVPCVVNRENLSALADLLSDGHVRVPIDRTYGLADAAQAVAHMLTHHARGKIAVTF